MRNEVMRATFEAFITASFEKAAEMHRIYAVETNTPLHPIVRDEGESETFGGDAEVVPIKKARKKRKRK